MQYSCFKCAIKHRRRLFHMRSVTLELPSNVTEHRLQHTHG